MFIGLPEFLIMISTTCFLPVLTESLIQWMMTAAIERPNQSLEPTTGRHITSLLMTKTSSSQAKLLSLGFHPRSRLP
jgi:hypothetical protein